MIPPEQRCTIDAALGRATVCPGPRCCFWEATEDACMFHGIERELLARPELSALLSELRDALTDGRPRDARMQLARVLNQGRE